MVQTKAAELIVVMGEILEEDEEVGGMRRLIKKYRSIHPRKVLFEEKSMN